MSAGLPRNPDLFQYGDQLWGIAPLAGSDDEGEGSTFALTRQMNLAGQAAFGTAQGLVGPVRDRRASSAGDSRRAGVSTSRVLVGPAGGGVHADHAPVDQALGVGVGLDGPQDPLPRAVC